MSDADDRPAVPWWGRGHDAALAYHARLLGDARRVVAFERALRALVRPGDAVLDLGTGTGLLAVLAARRGAAEVHAVESTAVADLALALAERNGVAGAVRLHRGDATALPAAAAVDLVVSDFLGRFVVDDGMLWAMEASRRWMKPGARWCPSEVRLVVAPVALGHFAPLDVFEAPVLGVDVSPAREAALHATYGAELAPEAVLAEPRVWHRLRPPDRGGAFDGALAFPVARAGRLRGLAGWFEATLAPGVVLATGPGVETHWHQELFPLPALDVAPGDTVEVRLRVAEEAPELVWAWEGRVVRASGPPVPFSLDSRPRWAPSGPPAVPAPGAPGEDPQEAGIAAWEAGDPVEAARCFERAVAALGPADDPRAAALFEDLGVAYAVAGAWSRALPCFLRALDGQPASREQSARLLVDAWFRTGRPGEGAAALAAYEAAFGPHPAGWRRG